MARVILSIGLAIVLVLVPLKAFEQLVSSLLWGPHVLAGVGAASVVLVFLRLMTRWIVWPTLIAAVVGIGVVAGVEGAGGNQFLLRPLAAGLSPWWKTLESAVSTLSNEEAPVTAGSGVGLIVGLSVVLMFVALEALAVGARAPALAGLPVLLLWSPPVVLGSDVAPYLIVAAIAAFVLLLGIAGRWSVRLASILPAVAATTAITVLASIVISPWALGTASWFGPGPRATDARIDLGLNIRDDLVQGEPFPVLRYRGLPPNRLGPLHSHTMTDFDGTAWHRSAEGEWDETAQLFEAATGAMFDPDQDSLGVEFIIDRLGQDRLFLPSAPRHAPTPHLYDPINDEVYAEPGDDVRLSLSGPGLDLDPVAWHERSLVGADLADEDRFLDIPLTSHRQDIIDLAEEITTRGESPYEKGVLLQDYLRAGEEFRYTTNVPTPTSDDAVWDFLTDGQGYCVQFATAMVVLARAAGIPARIAVGFLPGEQTEFSDGSRGGIVSSDDAHAWPQLFLGEAGWTRFEPTPAIRSGVLPSFARGLPADQESAEPEATPTPTETPTHEPTESDPAPEPTSAPTPRETTGSPWPAILTAAGAIVAGALGVWLWRRRARPDGRGVEDYWSLALAALRPLGLQVLPSHTPLQILAGSQRLDAPVDGEALEGLRHLTHAVMAARYEPAPPVVDEERLQGWLSQVESLGGR